MRTQPAAAGRFIDAEDVRLQRRVAFLGSEVARKIFGTQPAVGETIRLNGMAFKVVGVQREKVQLSNYARPDKESVFIPYTTAGQLWNTEYLSTFIYQAVDSTLGERTDRQVKELLGRRLRFNPADERALRIFGSAQLTEIISRHGARPEAGAGLHRRPDPGDRRRRRHEHHVRVGDRAHARDRPAQGAGREAPDHPRVSFSPRGWRPRSPAELSAS